MGAQPTLGVPPEFLGRQPPHALHEGALDLAGEAVRRRRRMLRQMLDALEAAGYEEIIPPTFEYAEVFVRAGGQDIADRLDDQPFSRDDLSALRTLTAPAALALSRERARRSADELARAAVTDPLSGLFNRRYFRERLEEELDSARRHNTTVALLMIDIDNFKSINDRFGHLTGDLVIRGVGDILKRSVRKFDLCTRYGGEEFAIVMPGSGPENAVPVAERIRQRIEDFKPAEAELAELHVTASIGMAVGQGISGRELIARADQALYQAKQAGKNRVVQWKPKSSGA